VFDIEETNGTLDTMVVHRSTICDSKEVYEGLIGSDVWRETIVIDDLHDSVDGGILQIILLISNVNILRLSR
jgi:hypothetical protein